MLVAHILQLRIQRSALAQRWIQIEHMRDFETPRKKGIPGTSLFSLLVTTRQLVAHVLLLCIQRPALALPPPNHRKYTLKHSTLLITTCLLVVHVLQLCILRPALALQSDCVQHTLCLSHLALSSLDVRLQAGGRADYRGKGKGVVMMAA